MDIIADALATTLSGFNYDHRRISALLLRGIITPRLRSVCVGVYTRAFVVKQFVQARILARFIYWGAIRRTFQENLVSLATCNICLQIACEDFLWYCIQQEAHNRRVLIAWKKVDFF